jgi:secreted PhoX family phosphatase
MKKVLLFLSLFAVVSFTTSAQTIFDEELEMPAGYNPNTVLLPPSPLSLQVLFVGQTDMVQTTETYGNAAGEVPAKEWHDFIGFTPDDTGNSLGWVSVNHEMRLADDNIGDGGGMTVFRVERDANDELVVMDQTLSDGRSGKFFNVDFVNTVGSTGMNCAGISSMADGRIWTAEEWAVTSNEQMSGWDRDTSDFTIGTGTADGQAAPNGFPGFDGETMKGYQSLNWMVEIDPREAVAIRKQYNWGRQFYEGGTILPDNQTVFLGEDATPGWFTKFVADTPGDFTQGTTYVYKHDGANGVWVELDNTDFQKMLNFKQTAIDAGATMFNRIEWVTYDVNSGKVYFTETGRDNPASRWEGELAEGAVLAPHHIARAAAQGTTADNAAYWDYYGRVVEFDPATDEMSVLIEGGPYFDESPAEADYPAKHLSNPDGIRIMQIDGQSFAVIQEDLNGSDYGRMPAGVPNRTCEVWLLDLSIENPTVDDLIRLTVVPTGAEVTGAVETPDGKSLLLNSQHPSPDNPAPYNHSLTFAIHGFDKVTVTDLKPTFTNDDSFQIYPNPTAQLVQFNQVVDAAIYDMNGKRMKVYRNVNEIDVSNFAAGTYFIQTGEGQIEKLIIQK